MVATNQSNATYDPGTLNLTIYYWQIIAHDNYDNQTIGSIWSFRTTGIASFQCGDQLIDTRDNQTYNTVQIGTQCWMAESLNVGTRIDGVNNQTNNNNYIEKYCYDDDPANCIVYGGLYQWDEMMQYVTDEGAQGICPPIGGWHLPTDDEWKTMEMHLGMTQAQADATSFRGTYEGAKMKSSSGWYNNGNGTNSSGFTGLPGGTYRVISGSFSYLCSYGRWWSSTETEGANAWDRDLHYQMNEVGRFGSLKTAGFSARCIKD